MVDSEVVACERNEYCHFEWDGAAATPPRPRAYAMPCTPDGCRRARFDHRLVGHGSGSGNLLLRRVFVKHVEVEPIGTQIRVRPDVGKFMITAAQCRSARTLLGWSVNKLASTASVSESDIDHFELERRRLDAATVEAIRRAFEDVGVVFLPQDDVQLVSSASAVR
jgi:hypothetical protein